MTRPVPMALRLVLAWLGVMLAVPVGPAAAAAVAPGGQALTQVSAARAHAVSRADSTSLGVLRGANAGNQPAPHRAQAALPPGSVPAHGLACAPAPASAAPSAPASAEPAQERGRAPPAAGASCTAGVPLPLPA